MTTFLINLFTSVSRIAQLSSGVWVKPIPELIHLDVRGNVGNRNWNLNIVTEAATRVADPFKTYS